MVAQRTLGWEASATERTLKAFYMAPCGCTTSLRLTWLCSTATQGALRDPGLCC